MSIFRADMSKRRWLLLFVIVIVLIIKRMTKALNNMSDQSYLNLLGAVVFGIFFYAMICFLLLFSVPLFSKAALICIGAVMCAAFLIHVLLNKVREVRAADPELHWMWGE